MIENINDFLIQSLRKIHILYTFIAMVLNLVEKAMDYE